MLLNTLTMETPYIQQWERRSYTFPLEMTPDCASV